MLLKCPTFCCWHMWNARNLSFSFQGLRGLFVLEINLSHNSLGLTGLKRQAWLNRSYMINLHVLRTVTFPTWWPSWIFQEQVLPTTKHDLKSSKEIWPSWIQTTDLQSAETCLPPLFMQRIRTQNIQIKGTNDDFPHDDFDRSEEKWDSTWTFAGLKGRSKAIFFSRTCLIMCVMCVFFLNVVDDFSLDGSLSFTFVFHNGHFSITCVMNTTVIWCNMFIYFILNLLMPFFLKYLWMVLNVNLWLGNLSILTIRNKHWTKQILARIMLLYISKIKFVSWWYFHVVSDFLPLSLPK